MHAIIVPIDVQYMSHSLRIFLNFIDFLLLFLLILNENRDSGSSVQQKRIYVGWIVFIQK